MTSVSTPYDELPYQSFPIEWTAPEKLALASLLHGGPRPPLDEYRVLEFGCGDGTNLIPMAFYRRRGEFVGIDGARSQIAIADAKRSALGLTNVNFVASDFRDAATVLSGTFDYIIAHGVFSWVSLDARDALLALCAERLRPGGLVYLSYNARPGWNVRGLIRDFLLAQTAGITGLRARTESARAIAARMAAELDGAAHPYSQLLANEFTFVGENPLSHTAHEYLAEHNHAYTRRQFFELASRHDLAYVADADFNHRSGRLSDGLPAQLARLDLENDLSEDTADLLCYRQLHSPILTQRGFARRPPDDGELSQLVVASCLVEGEDGPDDGSSARFHHPSGYEVEARSRPMSAAFRRLRPLWPHGCPMVEVFPEVREAADDLKLLHRNGMIELRLVDFGGEPGADPEVLNRLERRMSGCSTTAYHTVGAVAAERGERR